MSKKLPRANCLVCGVENNNHKARFCSNKCQMTFARREYIERWKAGLECGHDSYGTLVAAVKSYISDKYGGKCARCNWAEINPTTGKSPLTIDHIDGNWRNCQESNLILLCPNCHSLTSTYGALNKGSGRKRMNWERSVTKYLEDNYGLVAQPG